MPFSDPTHPFDDVILEWSLGRIIKIVISSNLEDPVYLRSFLLGRIIKTFFFKSAKLFGPFLTVYYV